MKSTIFLPACLCLGVCLSAMQMANAAVTRGPYLQNGTPSSVVVRWRTDAASDSVVNYGLAADALSQSSVGNLATTEHQVTLSGLQADTRYFYSIGHSGAVLAGDASYRFTTLPTGGSTKPARIWVLGDSGTANVNAAAVRDAYKAYTGSRGTDVWLMLGDNAYVNGTDAEYQAAVFDTYPELLRQSVVWSTMGNHDARSASAATQSGPYFDIFNLPASGEAGGLASGTEAYYSFDYGDIHFVCLDSHETDRSPGGAMLTWLEADLAATSRTWIIAFWHHPPYSKGSHDSDIEANLIEMRANALPILEAYGVDMVLSGHSHAYERSFLLNGHYGNSGSLTPAMILNGGDGREAGNGIYNKFQNGDESGAVYVVAGSSGQIGGGTLDHPAMFISLSQLGSMVLDVNETRIDAHFLTSVGAVADSFSIVKSNTVAADLNFDLIVDSLDLGLLMSHWGSSHAWADLNDDGTVDGNDLSTLLGSF